MSESAKKKFDSREACTFSLQKLVRDKTIERIEPHGVQTSYKIVEGSDLKQAIANKVSEEVQELLIEFSQENREEIIQELADVLEILEKLANFNGIKWESIISEKEKKKKERGGFSKGIYINSVSFPERYNDFLKTFVDQYRTQPLKYPENSNK